ncbi:MAG TPA: hypothetical protein VGF75_01515 [Candidatus Saccharimonadales bacterium]
MNLRDHLRAMINTLLEDAYKQPQRTDEEFHQSKAGQLLAELLPLSLAVIRADKEIAGEDTKL